MLGKDFEINPQNKRDIFFEFEKFGCSVVDNNIGKRANDNKTETKINKSTFAGSLIFNKN